MASSSTSLPHPGQSPTAVQQLQAYEKQGEQKVTELAKEDADSTDSNLRYMAYAQRLRTSVLAAGRYTAYTSDIGESFRPIVPPWVVTAAYGISWLYLVGDVSYETYKAKVRGPNDLEHQMGLGEGGRLGLVGVKRTIFQAVASMALPAFTIHSTVRYSTRAFAKTKLSPKVKAWGPTITGLAVVPFLPYLFDEPVEHAVDYLFEKIEHALVRNHAAVQGINSIVQGVQNVVGGMENEVGKVEKEVKKDLNVEPRREL